jgi:RNA polymerase sigma-70 factor (ECF subfamily)
MREATIAAAAAESARALSAEDEMLGTELERAIRKAIHSLPERTREVFQLSRDRGLKYVEIAAVLEISVKTVEKRMGQALSQLRDELAQWLPVRRED